MRIVLALFTILTLGVFGIVAAFDTGSTGTAIAGEGGTIDPATDGPGGICGDDGDEGDGDPTDDPDSEDDQNEFSAADDDDDDSVDEDSEDADPTIEYDDCPPFATETPAGQLPGDCGNMTRAGAYLFEDANYGGQCLLITEDNLFFNYTTCDIAPMICWNDIASSMKVVGKPNGAYLCLHSLYEGNCELLNGNIPNLNVVFNEECGSTPPPDCSMDNQSSSLYFPDGTPTPTPTSTAAPIVDNTTTNTADANCDGSTDSSDALSVIRYSTGADAGCTGADTGDGLPGDANCDDEVNTLDTLQILLILAQLEDEAAC